MGERDNKLPPSVHLGTCGWTAPGLLGSFYPKGTKEADFLRYYGTQYSTVEVDATFHNAPSESLVAGWREKVPDGFLLSSKAPKTITHTKFLEDCEHELNGFLKTMSGLGPKLGPIVFQFQYYTKRDGVTEDDFLTRLSKFLKTLPKVGYRFAVECRNKQWMNPALFEILHDNNVACCLIDHPWMSSPDQLFKHKEIVTGPFVYIRWLGDRKATESITKVFNKTVIDRKKDMERWIPHLEKLIENKTELFGYVDKHYGGYAHGDLDPLIEKLSN